MSGEARLPAAADGRDSARDALREPSDPAYTEGESGAVGKERYTLWPSEAAVSDVVGRLIEFWGFKRNMGRIWAVLYLSPEPLSAEDLRQALKLSSGAVSMTLNELARWGVVRKVWVQGERKDFYAAEVQLWRMISRVFSEREKTEIVMAIESFEEALADVSKLRHSTDPKTRARAELQYERIKQLLELARLGKRLVETLLATAKIDAEPLVRFLLRQAPPSRD
ncbi:MAG: ArsR family transcriptional regulator [Labilithrix sp.]|nr:ArsR family transcriptional regulator [Labilithrix sp.]